jgi:hypothetical protein
MQCSAGGKGVRTLVLDILPLLLLLLLLLAFVFGLPQNPANWSKLELTAMHADVCAEPTKLG